MKKLLIMASLFWPQKKSGGPPVSIMNLVTAIKDHFDIYVISNNHEINESDKLPGIKDGWNEFPFGKAFYIPYGQHILRNVERLIDEVQPDVIYQNSFFSYNDLLPVLKYKRKHKQVKVIVAPRGELYPERFRNGYWKKKLYSMLFRYSGMLDDVYFQGTGEDECAQERSILGIDESHLYNIQNLSMVAGEYAPISKKNGELKLVYVARIHPTKNTLSAVQLLKEVKGNVTYDIYGSIEDADYWALCQNAIAQLPQNITVNYKGVIDHNDVPAVLAGYHAYYMPTTGENFGHSIVESMLLGRPVIISDQTPWTDVNGNGGYAYSLDDKNGFVEALNFLVSLDSNQYIELSKMITKYINEKLNMDEIIQQYINAFGG